MKKFLSLLFLSAIIYFSYTYRVQIVEYILKNYVNNESIVIYSDNVYAKGANDFYKETTDFYPDTKEDIKNIFYTALNGGWDKVVFFCTSVYKNCINDVTDMTDTNGDFSKINNFVHPYNSYEKVYLSYNSFGKVEVDINRLYSNTDIDEINTVVNKVLSEDTNEMMSKREKIKAIHDYIINTTVYDEASAKKLEEDLPIDFISHKASGALIDHLAICGGYSDSMAIFLDKLDIPNYKLASTNHIWNYVYLDSKWYHLDVTWDDPVTSTGENILLDTFFLVTDDELKRLDTVSHNYQ